MSKKAGLGRGIGALIPTGPTTPAAETTAVQPASPASETASPARRRRAPKPGGRPVDVFFSGEEEGHELLEVPGATFAAVSPSEIRPNASQPRTVFDEDDLSELEHSIREFGVLQPIVVRPAETGEDGTKFELIMGERRWRASQRAGLESIPAIVKDTPDDAMLRDALLENLHRAQLNPLEEASAYQQLMEDFAITQDELSKRIGRSRPQISNTIRLLKLPESVQTRVASGVLSAGHARAILSLSTTESQEQLAAKIMGRWRDEPVGPHPQPMYQVAFEASEFAKIVPWLMLNRRGLVVLVHPNTGDAVADHDVNPLWLGEKLPLKIDFLREFVKANPGAI